jgi:hypothetical protein
MVERINGGESRNIIFIILHFVEQEIGKKMSTRGRNYTTTELDILLDLVETLLPLGQGIVHLYL